MAFASIILSLCISIMAYASWFGVLETLYCTHRADRIYFVGLTKARHEVKMKTMTSECSGKWLFSFDKKSIHHRAKVAHELKDWKIPREK